MLDENPPSQNDPKLGLYTHILPAIKIAIKDNDQGNGFSFGDWCAEKPIIFDCRQIDYAFLEDTGNAVLDECKQNHCFKLRLPFSSCYFEFDAELAVWASETNIYYKNLDDVDLDGMIIESDIPQGTLIEFQPYFGWTVHDGAEDYADLWDTFYGVLGYNPVPSDDESSEHLIGYGDCNNPVNEVMVSHGATFLVAILTLLDEKLISSEVKDDPAPKLNKARIKRGKLPISSERRVLTINTAAVRRIAQKPAGTHESPRLHWRRGHWRILHRGSEFESQTWVRRCLVGDPERGFIHKDYRLTWMPPMLEHEQPPIV